MADKLEPLIEAYTYGEERLTQLKGEKYRSYNFERLIFTFSRCFESRAWHNCLISGDMDAAKQAFYNCGLADIEDVKRARDIFGYNRNSPIYAALSDSVSLIQTFKTLEYTLASGPNRGKTNKQLAKIGKGHIYIDTIIMAMNKDESALAANLKTMEDVTLKLKKNVLLKTDFDFFKGLLDRDKDRVFNAINELATKQHKRRNREESYKKLLVSQPALGYAKIAWINEMELEFDSPLIINELLPIRPVKEYVDEIQPYKSLMVGS